MNISLRRLLVAVMVVALVVSACGGEGEQDAAPRDDAQEEPEAIEEPTEEPTVEATEEPTEEPTAEVSASPGGGCSDIEEVKITSEQHVNKELTPGDYSTNPPAGGDHSSEVVEVGAIYDQPQPLGRLVHSLEHGAVIGWTNNLSEEQTQQVGEAFNALFQEGYKSLIVVEYPDMDVPFALSAWGAVQTCNGIDPFAIGNFVGTYYASGPEGELACVDPQGGRVKVPMCEG